MHTKLNENELPNHLFGADLTREDKQNLLAGKFSQKKEFYINGEHKIGKVKFENEKFHFLFEKKEEIKIPDQILKKKLKPEEKEQLLKGFELNIDKKTSILLDKNLNRIIIKSKQANKGQIPKKIGEYILSAEDKKTLSQGNPLSTKVFKGQYGYFIANVRLTDDSKGLEFSNIKGLKPNEINTYIDKYNKQQPYQKNTTTLTNDDKTLTQAIKDNDYDKIHELVKNGTEVKQEHIDLANNKSNNIEKIAALTSLGVESPKQEIDAKIPEKNKKLTNEKKQPKEKNHNTEKTIHHAKGLIDTGFNNM